MSRNLVQSLSDVRAGDEAHLLVICHCGRECTFDIADVLRYFRARGWSDAYRGLARRFRCSKKAPWGCGRTAKEVRICLGAPQLPFDRMPELP